MLGSVVPHDAFEQLLGRSFTEGFDEALRTMCVEVVENQMNTTGLRIPIGQLADEPCKIDSRALAAGSHQALSRLGFDRHKHAAGPAAAVFVILLGDLSWCGGLRRTRVVEQLNGLFVETNHRLGRIERLFVLVENILHPLAEFLGEFGNAPSFFRHGFKSCSFSHSATSLLLTDRTIPCSAACWQSSSNVQRTRPSGGVLQARAMTCCCCRGVKLAGVPHRGASYKARSTPAVQNRLRTLRTVRSPQPTCSTISSSVRPSSDLSNISARRTTRTGRVPDCANCCNCCRASSVRRTIWSFMPELIAPAAISRKTY